jgi:hypothetical protein
MKIQNSKIKLISKVVLTAIIFSLVSCGTKEDPTKNKNNVEALEDVKTAFGEKIQEAIITEANVLYISVVDNGIDQSRFAETICNLLKKHNATTNWVKVVKVNSSNEANADNAYGVLLGEANCN